MRYAVRSMQYSRAAGRSVNHTQYRLTYEAALNLKEALEARGAAEVTITPEEEGDPRGAADVPTSA